MFLGFSSQFITCRDARRCYARTLPAPTRTVAARFHYEPPVARDYGCFDAGFGSVRLRWTIATWDALSGAARLLGNAPTESAVLPTVIRRATEPPPTLPEVGDGPSSSRNAQLLVAALVALGTVIFGLGYWRLRAQE